MRRDAHIIAIHYPENGELADVEIVCHEIIAFSIQKSYICNTFKMLEIMNVQYISDSKGEKLAVILPIKEYHQIIDDLDEFEDIKLYDAAKKGTQEFIDAELAFREIEETRKNKM